MRKDKLSRVFTLAFGLTVLTGSQWALAAEQCPATKEYLLQLQENANNPGAEPGFSDACFVTWSEISENIKQYQLIDIRDPEDYAKFHLLGSINLESRHIKTKAFLKSQPLLIIDHGASFRRLGTLCAELRSLDFNQVKILRGGVNVGIARGLPINGVPDYMQAFAVTPQLAMEEYFTGGLVFATIDKNKADILTREDIGVEMLDAKPSATDFIDKLAAIAYQEKYQGKTVAYLDPLSYQRFGQLNAEQSIRQVYVLEGGFENLMRFLDNAEWIKMKRNSVPTRFQCPNF